MVDTRMLTPAERARVYARVRTGDLVRVTRCIFAPPDIVSGERWDRWAAFAVGVSYRYPDAVVMGEAAAVLHGFPLAGRLSGVSLQVGRGMSGPRVEGVRFRSAQDVCRADSVVVESRWGPVRVTSPVQTAVDVARFGCPEDAVVVFDHCLRVGLFSVADVVERLRVMRRSRWLIRVVRLLPVVSGAAESPRESLVRYVLWCAGCPVPWLQAEVVDRRGVFVGRVDFLFRDSGVVVEYDGREKYGLVEVVPGVDSMSSEELLGQVRVTQRALLAEQERQQRLELQGLRVVRVNWRNFRDNSWLEVVRRLSSDGGPLWSGACRRWVPGWSESFIAVSGWRRVSRCLGRVLVG